MSELESRVGALERDVTKLGQQVEHVSADLGHLRGDVRGVAENINKLIERENKRDQRNGEALTWRGVAATILVTASICGALAGFSWWMVAVSPAVSSLTERMTDLDHPKRGRVTEVERRQERIDGWATQVRAK